MLTHLVKSSYNIYDVALVAFLCLPFLRRSFFFNPAGRPRRPARARAPADAKVGTAAPFSPFFKNRYFPGTNKRAGGGSSHAMLQLTMIYCIYVSPQMGGSAFRGCARDSKNESDASKVNAWKRAKPACKSNYPIKNPSHASGESKVIYNGYLSE